MKLSSRFAAIAVLVTALQPASFVHATTDIEGNVQHVAEVICGNKVNGEYVAMKQGSGVLVGESIILTNAHVVTDEDHSRFLDWCVAGVSPNAYTQPAVWFGIAGTEYSRYDDNFDYAFMNVYDDEGLHAFDSYAQVANGDSMTLNEEVMIMGYPASGGETVTTTSGNIAGFEGTTWIKTDVLTDEGSSGGAGFDVNGNLFGLMTAISTGAHAQFSYLQNINAIFEDAFGPDEAERNYSNLYTGDNVFCLDGSCYQYAEDEGTWTDNVTDSEEVVPVEDVPVDEVVKIAPEEPTPVETGLTYTVPENARYDEAHRNTALQTRMKGYILLQVEQHGEAWYVNVNDGIRYYMRDGAIAYQMMRSFGLGITDADLEKIPAVNDVEAMRTATSVCKTNALANRLKGQILLQIQQHGEAWYIHPDTCRRIYMKDGDVAYSTMRFLSLGITDNDLAQLPYSSTLVIK
jgi:V8-like Glu-specific endopeptidase